MHLKHLSLFAAIALAAGITPRTKRFNPFETIRVRTTARTRRPAPTMVCSSPTEIAAWNAAVDKKKMALHVRRMHARVYAKNLSKAAEAHQASAKVAA